MEARAEARTEAEVEAEAEVRGGGKGRGQRAEGRGQRRRAEPTEADVVVLYGECSFGVRSGQLPGSPSRVRRGGRG